MKRKTMTTIIALVALLFFLSSAVQGETFMQIMLDGKQLEVDVAPIVLDGRTMVPLRVIAENLGAAVNWSSVTRTVEITSPEQRFMNGYLENQMYIMLAEEVKPLFESEAISILDVRPLAAYESSFIEKSIHIPMPELLDRMEEVPADVPVAVLCSKNINAAYAVMMLNMSGWEAYLMEDGIGAWKDAGGVTSSCRR